MSRDPRRRKESQENGSERSETSNRVVELLNQAQLSDRDGKLECLGQAQELVFNREPDLLPVYLEEFLAYHHDRHPDVRKLVVSFMEEAGVTTVMIKFVEMIVLSHSAKTEMSEVPKNVELTVSLDMIAADHPFIKPADLRSSCGEAFESLLKLTTSPSISCVNLMACIGCLANISRQRPAFMPVVVQAFESLHANMPPTYTKSHVNSVVKNMKTLLLSFLRHSSSVDFHSDLIPLLTEIGCTPNEIDKNRPKVDSTKRLRNESAPLSTAKKSKLHIDETSIREVTPTVPAIDVTFEDIFPRLTPELVAEVVFCTMERLPDLCPDTFLSSYIPEDNPGTQMHVTFLAHMLAAQMTAAGVGIGMQRTKEKLMGQVQTQKIDLSSTSSEKLKANDTSRGNNQFGDEEWNKKPRIRQQKQFVLADVTRRNLSVSELRRLATNAMKRIQANERGAAKGGTSLDRVKLMVSLATQQNGGCREALFDYVMSDFQLHYDVMLAWLFEEYAVAEGYKGVVQPELLVRMEKYDKTVTDLLAAMRDQLDPKDKMFTRLLLDLPRIPPVVLDIIRSYCEDEDRVVLGVATMRDLILTRPAVQEQFLGILLELTGHEKETVRIQAIHVAKRLHSKDLLSHEIERFACEQVDTLVRNFPTGEDKSEDVEAEQLDERIRLCLQLFIGLLPLNHSLLHKLSDVYVEVTANVKKVVLRMLDHAVRAMGMHSSDIHTFIELCPRGAETLLIRILHILTEKAAPISHIVHLVREVYRKRIPDVQVLVPILNALDKAEILTALPQLVKQSPAVVKEVIGRLLGMHRGGGAGRSQVTAQELMVAMHNIDVSEENTMKAVMKAISLLFQERTVYTQEVLSVVLHQLMDLTPLPTLFMRTVIQARQACPRLIPFIMNILSRLITKQVWKQPSVWQGFVKCCQLTKPQSFQIMLQLPPRHLQSVFEISAELKEQLKAHISSFTPHQRGLIPRAILQVIEKETQRKSATRASSAKVQEAAAMVEEHVDVDVQDLALDAGTMAGEESAMDELEGAALRKTEAEEIGDEQEQGGSTDVQQMETVESGGDNSLHQ
ncbi:symplekin-like isoform X2 [Corticium candelabrum]|uniref:symplekin-like isoform X2 n=1 Tax=Corticium candelabrum TaxID=121492 RepID=UPI002E25F809|nr:symplekin-like isoform X2 [Corticium candelabrum]